jgi:histidine triad (HIT) family protein
MIADMSCIFCAIAAGEVPATVVHQSERVVAFRDLNPVAPVHVLVVPREHYRNVVELSADAATAAELLAVVSEVANAENVSDGFRTVFNTGADAGQEVDHVHAHVIGGRQMQWPPG